MARESCTWTNYQSTLWLKRLICKLKLKNVSLWTLMTKKSTERSLKKLRIQPQRRQWQPWKDRIKLTPTGLSQQHTRPQGPTTRVSSRTSWTTSFLLTNKESRRSRANSMSLMFQSCRSLEACLILKWTWLRNRFESWQDLEFSLSSPFEWINVPPYSRWQLVIIKKMIISRSTTTSWRQWWTPSAWWPGLAFWSRTEYLRKEVWNTLLVYIYQNHYNH